MVSPNFNSVPVALGVSFLLGLRHAADPDHLVAVSTLVAGARERGARAAAGLAAAWGAGHALTLLAFGLPILLAGWRLPERFQAGAEVAIGLMIVGLAAQLLWRWRRGAFHAHPHEHAGLRHVHLHPHAVGPDHSHEHQAPRSPWASFLVGSLHGTGGSAAVAVLLLGGAASPAAAALALVLLAAGAAVAMTVLSAGFGVVLGRGFIRRRLSAAIPLLGGFGVLFGTWYAFGAASLVPYPL
jgi:ABC-type nickel/cobalt efflux system permease component RcnA